MWKAVGRHQGNTYGIIGRKSQIRMRTVETVAGEGTVFCSEKSRNLVTYLVSYVAALGSQAETGYKTTCFWYGL